MKSILLALLLFQAPDQVIEGSQEAPPDYLCVLDASLVPASATSWTLVNPPEDDNHQVLDDGRLFFSTGIPGKYQFVFAFVVENDKADEPPEIHQVLHALTITGTPPPVPGPTPGPVLPDGQYKLAQMSRDEAIKLGDYSVWISR
jgi:hypothetical protein